MNKIAILGAGGHAKVIIDTVKQMGSFEIIGIFDRDNSLHGSYLLDIEVLGGDELLLNKYDPGNVKLVNAIGTIKASNIRENLYKKFKKSGFSFATIIHPSSYISPTAKIQEGVQILAKAIVQTDAIIEANVILNTGSIVEHDCVINSHTHIAPSATLSGSVFIGSNCHIGTGSTIIQGIRLGNDITVGAGAVVCKSFDNMETLKGIPAAPNE